MPEFNLVIKIMGSDMKGETQDALGVCYKAGHGEGAWSQRKSSRGSYYLKEE